MAFQFSFRKIFLGVTAGFISGLLALLLDYFVGVIVIAVRLREAPATLLAALTVLPLMLIFVLLLPTMIITGVVGFLSGVGSKFSKRAFSVVTGALLGLAAAEVVLSLVVPLIMTPKPGDFVSIISQYYLSGAYGLLIGGLTSRMFRWIGAD
jgi:hypothetical protein